MKAITPRRLLIVTAGLAALGGMIASAVSDAAEPTGGNPNPIAAHALGEKDRFTRTGEVLQRLPAGSYLYLQLHDEGGDWWVATLGATATAADRVQVTAFARADRFESRRLRRVFSPLVFGAVRVAPVASSPERTSR
jgi:hypothetical protein